MNIWLSSYVIAWLLILQKLIIVEQKVTEQPNENKHAFIASCMCKMSCQKLQKYLQEVLFMCFHLLTRVFQCSFLCDAPAALMRFDCLMRCEGCIYKKFL
jgi:hypothetical protein